MPSPRPQEGWILAEPLSGTETDAQSGEVFRTKDGRPIRIRSYGSGICRLDVRGLNRELLRARLSTRMELITDPEIVKDLMRQMKEAMAAALSRRDTETQPSFDCSE